MAIRFCDDLGRRRILVDRRRAHDTDVARSRRRREGVARRSRRLARGVDRAMDARRAGGGRPAPRPPQPRLGGDRRAARRSPSDRADGAAGDAVRGGRGQAVEPLAGGGPLVAGAADARGRRGPRHERVLPRRRRPRRRPRAPEADAAADACAPTSRSTCSSGTARASTGPDAHDRAADRRSPVRGCRSSRGG